MSVDFGCSVWSYWFTESVPTPHLIRGSLALRENCLYSEFFLFVFSRIRAEYGREKFWIWTLFTQCRLICISYIQFYKWVFVSDSNKVLSNVRCLWKKYCIKEFSYTSLIFDFWLAYLFWLDSLPLSFFSCSVYYTHCGKSVHNRSFSGPHFPAFELNTERYEVSLRIQNAVKCGPE